MMKVMHIISGLNDGGAEGVLYRLCIYDNQAKHIVVSMMNEGKYGPLLKAKGIQVHSLNMSAGKFSFPAAWLLFRLIRHNRPDLVQTWMYHADFFGGLIAKIAGIKRVFWNVRHTNFHQGKSKRSTLRVLAACKYLSSWMPKFIIYCAHEAQVVHESLGYKREIAKVISNGYDFKTFYPNLQYEMALRSEIKISKNSNLLGLVGRFNPQKDHNNLISALSLVKASGYEFSLVLIGDGMNNDNHALTKMIEISKISSKVHLLGQRSDISLVMNAIDLHILPSSHGEAFPNVLAEAMACGTPCVTTDVGDAALIVGQTGWVVTPQDPQALADSIIKAIEEMQNKPIIWAKRKDACRERVTEMFSIEKMLTAYHDTWKCP